jgi:hypothetical protein
MQKTDELIEVIARALSEEMYGRMGLAEQAGHENNRNIARAALHAIEASGCEIRPKVTRRREPSIGYLTKGG